MKLKENLRAESSQGEVYRGTLSATLKLPVAIKVLYADRCSKEAFVAEVTALRQLLHRNILKMETFFEKPQYCIVTLWKEQGALDQVLSRCRESGSLLSWETKGRDYARDIACGLEYLHAQGAIHRDLKSLNVLLGVDDVAVLADFGNAEFVGQNARPRVAKERLGTTHWMAPEVIEKRNYSFASDMYDYAIIVWELCACELPWQKIGPQFHIRNAVKKGERPFVKRKKWPKEAVELMEACWRQQPRDRLTAEQVVSKFNSKPAEEEAKVAAVAAVPKKVVLLEAEGIGLSAQDQYRRGMRRYKGARGVRKNQEAAARLFRLAAHRGHSEAQFMLGICYADAKGIAQNDVEASRWFLAAAEQNHAFACFNAAWFYDTGSGTAANSAQAGCKSGLFTEAGKLGHAEADRKSEEY